MKTIYIEGVPYNRFRVYFRDLAGRRRQLTRWSPGYPWVRGEIAREFFDRGDVKPGSAVIRGPF